MRDASPDSFVTPSRRLPVLERQRLDEPLRIRPGPEILPRGGVREVRVVAHRLAVGRLVLLPEVAAARLAPLQRVPADQLAEFQEVRDASRLLQRRVELLAVAEDVHVLPEFLAK